MAAAGCNTGVLLLVADEVMASQSSVLTNTSGAASAASPDVTVLELVDRLGLAKYARVFIEQEVIVFIWKS